MRVKYGFISNSSSTNFCLYGIRFQETDEKDVDVGNLENKARQVGLEVFYGNPNNWRPNYYIGKSFSDIKDTETGGQFKESVRIALKSVDLEGDCNIYEEGYYNG